MNTINKPDTIFISFIFLLILILWLNPCQRSNAGNLNYNSSDTPYLPKPYVTRSAIKPSKVVGWKDNQMPIAPDGFKVTKFAADLENPRWLYQLPNGDILVAEVRKESKGKEKFLKSVSGLKKAEGKSDAANRITLFRDSNKDGIPDLRTVFIPKLNLPFGMLLLKNYFYVATMDAVWRYPYKEGETSISVKGEKIISLPTSGRHWTKNIIASPDGSKIYIAIGSASDHAENGIENENRRACILEINPDGSGERLYASGLRNPVGMDWQPGTPILWTAVNERDMLGDDLPPDFITSVKDGGFYGWPYSYYGQNLDPRIKEKDQRPDLVKKALAPDLAVGGHTGSLGFSFYDKNAFPSKYHKGAFIGQHGSWNRSKLNGYKILFVPFNNGKVGTPEDFLTGFISDLEERKVFGRPVGVIVLNDGSLLVADDAGNTVWRVSYSG